MAQLKTVKLGEVVESKTNPRKTFDKEALADLTASIKEQGVLVPLIVRANASKKLEIIAGARRFRAAKAAGLKEIRVLVSSMTDAQALEAQVIENLQREDIHPMDEADGYRALMDRLKYDADQVADKVGKSASYVYQRLKLADLKGKARQSFIDGQLTAGHAILIARLSEKQQAQALEKCTMTEGGWQEPKRKYLIGVRDLSAWIAREIHRKLSAAPWKKDDAGLLRKAGPCSTCPKRAGNDPGLYEDVAGKDTCTDGACYALKMGAFIIRKRKELEDVGHKVVNLSRESWTNFKNVLSDRQWSKTKKPVEKLEDCGGLRKGIVVEGRDMGHVVDVCTKYGCRKKTHGWPSHTYGSGQASQSEKDWKKQHEAQQRREKVKREITRRTREDVYCRVIRLVSHLGKKEQQLLAACMGGFGFADGIDNCLDLKEVGLEGIPTGTPTSMKDFSKMNETQLARYMVATALASDIQEWGKAVHLEEAAKLYTVPMAKIEEHYKVVVKQEIKHAEQVKKWKARKASKKRSFDEPTCKACGCIEKKACPGGCSWVELNESTNVGLCSACAPPEKD